MAGGNGALVEVCLIPGHSGIGRCEGSPSRDTAGDPIDSETVMSCIEFSIEIDNENKLRNAMLVT